MIKSRHLLLFVLAILLLSTCQKENPTRILVLGDVQLASTIDKWNKEEWVKQRIDSSQFPQILMEVLSKEKPDHIFQTGDWVNYNNSLSLQIKDTTGAVIESSMPLPYDEWAFMHKVFPTEYKDRFYIAMGNHESYQDVQLQGILVPGVDHLANLNTIKFDLYDPANKKELLLKQFPHLKAGTFHEETATYFLEMDQFCLLSIDGMDKNRADLLAFIEHHLSASRKRTPSKNIFVISHYPIFTGLPKEEDSKLTYSDIREDLISFFDKYQVPLYLNGHEHFYLRYKQKGMALAQFEEPYPETTKYLTISNFVNPYGRELKRISPDTINDDALVYFNGIHYSMIEIKDDGLTVVTYAYNEEDKTWFVLDEF